MAITLEQYAEHLAERADLNWPAPPEVEPAKAKAAVKRLPKVRAVTWSVYGTLLNIKGGELYFEHPQAFVMEVALEKTIQEFKMWASMSRKPGKPSDYLKSIYKDFLADRKMRGGGEKNPEVSVETIWEAVIERLKKNDYIYDVAFYGSPEEFSQKIAYFFHVSLQGAACYKGAVKALLHVSQSLSGQGLLGNGQCFTAAQVSRGLQKEGGPALSDMIPSDLIVLSHEHGARMPSDTLFTRLLSAMETKGIGPSEILHVGSSVAHDVAPAKKFGMRTALFAGDKASLKVTPEEWKKDEMRPDVLLTKLDQIVHVVG